MHRRVEGAELNVKDGRSILRALLQRWRDVQVENSDESDPEEQPPLPMWVPSSMRNAVSAAPPQPAEQLSPTIQTIAPRP